MKRLQIIMSDEAWVVLDKVYKDANTDFKIGSINYSDVINEMILTSKVDLRELRLKHTDIRKSLLSLAKSTNVDVDSALKILNEIRSRNLKKHKVVTQAEDVPE